MNKHVVVEWPRLNLARELPFSLAGMQVRPAALEIEIAGEVAALEPRVMKVLVALHRSRGQPVSRDDLIDLCWEGRIVTEGAINRCIAQLRKALSANPAVVVDTIATVGYRLKVEGGRAGASPYRQAEAADRPALDAAPPPAPAGDLPSRGPSRLALGVGLAAIAAAAGAALLLLPRPVTWAATSYHPLTAERGLETHPALSPDGEQLVYAQRPDSSVGRELYIRAADQGTPVRITDNPADDHGAAWSPRGDRIAFVRTPARGPCSLVVAPVPLGPERVVGRCRTAGYTRVGWLDDDTLILADRPLSTDRSRVRAVDLATGAARDLTAPPPETLGDYDPIASPDGRQIVFRRSLMHGADDLFLKDLRTGRERALTTDGWKAAGFVWSADGRHVFYSSNRGGEFGLWTVDTRAGGPPRRISLGLGQHNFSRISVDSRNRLAVEASRGRINIAAVSPAGGLTAITNTAGHDWDPQAAPDGAVAYVSSRSGASEIWVTHPDGRSVRLTSIVGSYVNSPTWSPDGQSLAFVAVKGRRSEIYTVARDGSRLRGVTGDAHDKLDPVWAADGRALRYLQRGPDGYRLMSIALAPGSRPQVLAGGRGWRQLRGGPDGRLFGLPTGSDRVEALQGPAPRVEVAYGDSWAVGREGLYVLTARREGPPALWLHPWTGAPRRLAEVPTGTGDLSVAPDGRVLLSQNLDEQIDLGLFELAAS